MSAKRRADKSKRASSAQPGWRLRAFGGVRVSRALSRADAALAEIDDQKLGDSRDTCCSSTACFTTRRASTQPTSERAPPEHCLSSGGHRSQESRHSSADPDGARTRRRSRRRHDASPRPSTAKATTQTALHGSAPTRPRPAPYLPAILITHADMLFRCTSARHTGAIVPTRH